MDLLRSGSRFLARGARTGSSGWAGLGAALLAVGWLRKRARPDRELLYARTLKQGEALRIRLAGSDEELVVDG
jgi:hypothetical protein